MPSIVDYSSHQAPAASRLSSASNVILIDNYDSFTWNVYQYLVLEGAAVTVHRNDKITLDELIAQQPTQLIVSPGPGHPETDSGVSRDAIQHFAGKIPVLGVCMGQQCIFTVYGGHVRYAGEIRHGKTSKLQHDSRGTYAGLEQDIPVTRYHSLAGTYPTLPECLEVSSWIVRGDDERIIQGVRHKEYTVEGVQFHPESILTKGGRTMFKNFLRMRGGTWAENERLQKASAGQNVTKPINESTARRDNILDKIFEHRKAAVAKQKQIPGQRPEDLQARYDQGHAPDQISLVGRLKKSPFRLSLMAEIKRASPSKGIISLSKCALKQARDYALGGASVISVLTEPEWFKGSLQDLQSVRKELDCMRNRPAVLRKEFIFDEYQILEARLGGADTVLLIVKMLDEATLTTLYRYSLSLGMEPLVEVNTAEEMAVAIKLGAKVIGVNNRNLTSFEVDLDTTSRLLDKVPKETIVCALSGISGPKDVEAYQSNGVGAVLVGEALMRATDATRFINELLGGELLSASKPAPPLVKICGTRTPEAAAAAVVAGADLIGMILVPGRKRTVSPAQAIAISKVVHETPHPNPRARPALPNDRATDFFASSSLNNLTHPTRALLIGVFQNQTLPEILSAVHLYNLDVVQLHGDEPLEWTHLLPRPVIKSFKPGQPGLGNRGYHSVPLLDSASGGSGERLDFQGVRKCLEMDNKLMVLLAGGLDAGNIQEAIRAAGGGLGDRIIGVDVSSGVEENDIQSLEKIGAFIKAAKLN